MDHLCAGIAIQHFLQYLATVQFPWAEVMKASIDQQARDDNQFDMPQVIYEVLTYLQGPVKTAAAEGYFYMMMIMATPVMHVTHSSPPHT